MIVFENAGEIDIRSITSFGVSVKTGDSPIGFFGTGLKYAIAVLLRMGQKVEIYSGEKRFSFSTKTETLRGKHFDFVYVEDGTNSTCLGFTTELGKQWELWMAYRELICNCKDEKGAAKRVNDAAPESGKTKVVVCGAEFDAVFSNGHQYVLEKEPMHIEDGVSIGADPSHYFFYRGIRVANLNAAALYTYNATDSMELTEDRTLKSPVMIQHAVVKAVLRSKNPGFINSCITAKQGTFEHGIDYHGWSIQPSTEFLKVVGDCLSDRAFQVNATAAKVWEESSKKDFSPLEIELTHVQKISLDRALDFCAGIGFKIRDAYPIKIVESLGTGGLGLAKNNTIFIAERVFHLGGTKQLASTLIEEYIHLRHGWGDMTRELQSFLFDKVVSLGEEIKGEPL